MRLLSAWTLLPWLFRRATAVRVSLLVSYDGTSFRGWNDIRDTALRPALQRILAADTPPLLDASSRTDAGVHALGQVCAFSTPESATLDMDQLAYSLNQLLPDAVAVRRANAVADGFDPRSNSGKEYRYRLRVDMEGRAPLSRLYEWQIFRRRAAPPWDAAAAAAAAALCEGELIKVLPITLLITLLITLPITRLISLLISLLIKILIAQITPPPISLTPPNVSSPTSLITD